MGAINYAGNAIIPAGYLNIEKQFERTEDGRLKRRTYAITLKGTIVPDRGSPDSTGAFWTGSGYPSNETLTTDEWLAAILAKQGALNLLFSMQGETFEVQPWDGSAPTTFHPRINRISFGEGQWVNRCEYVVSMEADRVFWGGVDEADNSGQLEPEESWSIEVENAETQAYRVSHTVSSQQRAVFDTNGSVLQPGWQVAQAVVETKTGRSVPNSMLPANVLTGNYKSTNFTRGHNVDEANGRFSVTENWIYTPNQNWQLEFTVNTRISEGRTRVTVDGNVTGFVTANPNLDVQTFQDQKFAQAESGYASIQGSIFSWAQSYSGKTLNPTAVNSSVGKSPKRGSLSFSREWGDQPTTAVIGAITESLTLTDTNPSDIFASLGVLGRSAGPVLQNIATVTSRKRAVSFECQMSPKTMTDTPNKPDTNGLLLGHKPGGSVVFLDGDVETWNEGTGRYSRQMSWTWQS